MVSRSGHIVAHLVHQLDDLLSPGDRTEHLTVAFYLVTAINEDNLAAFFKKFLTNTVKARITEISLRTAVNIARRQDDNVLVLFLRFFLIFVCCKEFGLYRRLVVF